MRLSDVELRRGRDEGRRRPAVQDRVHIVQGQHADCCPGSIVALPICGNRNVFFSETYSGLSFGSPSNTSSPAAATRPLLRAAMRSSSTTNPPRAVFTTMAPGGRRLMALEFKKWRV